MYLVRPSVARHIGPTASLEVALAVLLYLSQLLTSGFYRDASFLFLVEFQPLVNFR